MKCAKCDFKSDDKKKMAEHLKKKHKIKNVSEYSFYGDNEKRIIEKLEDIHLSEEHEQLDKKKIMSCAICNKEGIKETISKEEINKILILDAKIINDIPKTTKGYFGEGTEPSWVCENCYKENKLWVKHWDFVKKLQKMQEKLIDECETNELNLVEKSIFDGREWDEFNMKFTYIKKIKKEKKYFYINVWYDHIRWGMFDDEEHKKYFTPEQIKKIEEEAKKLFNFIMDENDKISKKNISSLGVIDIEHDEGSVTYRKDFSRYENTGGILVTIDSYPEYGDGDVYVDEILDSDIIVIGKWILEAFVTTNKIIYECIWEKEKKDDGMGPIKKELVSDMDFNLNTDSAFKTKEFKTIDTIKLRKLLTDEIYESDILFGRKDFRFFRDYKEVKDKDKKYLLGPHTLINYQMQYRDVFEHEPFSKPIEVEFYQIRGIVKILEKIIGWIKELNKEIVIYGKINKVGENSRHIILDKSKGLKLFEGWEDYDYFEPSNERDIEIKYERGRITIKDVKSHEKKVLFDT